MIVNLQSWKKLFLFCLGLAAGAGFCMKWMESDFWSQHGQFTILGLELSYSREKTAAVLAGLDDRVRTILNYHLCFDFAFTAGVYPGIVALCMMAKEKVTSLLLRRMLHSLAALQLVAWTADCIENYYLLHWVKQPVIAEQEFSWYHFIVWIKWSLIAMAVFLAIPLVLRRKKKQGLT